MDRLLQFVLFAVFASSYSYNIDRKSSQFEPKISHEYPEEFIEKLIAALSPEELEKLKIKKTDVGDRDGDSSTEYCSWYYYDSFPKQLPAADRRKTQYFVVNTKKYEQKFKIQVCDSNNDDRCFENATEIVDPGSKGCCIPKEESIEMLVLSVPVEGFKSKVEKETTELVKKNMYLKTKCSCENIVMDLEDDGKCDMRYIL